MNKFLEARVKRKYYNKIQKKSFYKLLKSGFYFFFFLQRFYRKEILKAKKPEKQDNVFDFSLQ